jgi:hypothetical protein
MESFRAARDHQTRLTYLAAKQLRRKVRESTWLGESEILHPKVLKRRYKKRLLCQMVKF